MGRAAQIELQKCCGRIGIEKMADGQLATLLRMATSVVVTTPIRIAPVILRAIKTSVRASPKHAICTSRLEKFPSVMKVAGLATTSFASRKPTNAINIPMPAAVECFTESGMALTICSRTLVTVSTRKRTPEKKYDAQCRAPWDPHAKAHGIGEVGVERHAGGEGNRIIRERPMTSVATAAERQVAKSAPSAERRPARGSAGSPPRCRPSSQSGDAAEHFLLYGSLISAA